MNTWDHGWETCLFPLDTNKASEVVASYKNEKEADRGHENIVAALKFMKEIYENRS
jgi:hypothetical protein